MASSEHYRFLFAIALLSVSNVQSQSNCACKGRKDTHGYCGYHVNVFSNERRPWCRTADRCGQASMLGSWDYCDYRAVERRHYNGKWLTSQEFSDTYGSRGKSLYLSAIPEQRQAHDGQWYTAHQFRDFYFNSEGERGWLLKWESAQQRSWNDYYSGYGQKHGYSSEQRQANDGKWYTWREFQDYYGSRATEMWNNAGAPPSHYGYRVERRLARDGRWYTWREFEDFYGYEATDMWNKAGRSDL